MGAARTSGERVATSRIDGIMLKVNVFDEFEGGNTALLYLKMLLIAMVDYLSFVWNMGYEEKWIQYTIWKLSGTSDGKRSKDGDFKDGDW
jgi:hypothetical protein